MNSKLLPFILAGLSLLGTIYMQATRSDKESVQRISAIEAHQGDASQRLDRIEAKLDRLMEAMLGHR